MTVAPDQPPPDAAPEEGWSGDYTDEPGLLSILAGNVLWATASGSLNDISEVGLGSACSSSVRGTGRRTASGLFRTA
jgi:hypothetical protein